MGGVRVCLMDSGVYWLVQRQLGHADNFTNGSLKGSQSIPGETCLLSVVIDRR